MGLFSILALLLTLAAVFSYLNHRFIRLPTTIGVMAIALVASLAVIGLDAAGLGLEAPARRLLTSIDFDSALLEGMLSFLLFAGALHVNINDLLDQRGVIGVVATVGLLTSTVLVGTLTYLALGVLGMEISFLYCLVFGSLISPTDPIAVLGILKSAGAPKSLETKIAGESLFNDGVAVVIFLVLAGLATGGGDASAGGVALLFAQEALGGAAFGLITGYVAYLMLRDVDNYQVEVLITLALVTGGYAAAMALHLSGPIAIVIAGLMIGNRGRALAMSDTTREHLDTFWELVDEILNAVLFLLVGLEVMIIKLSGPLFVAMAAAIVITLASRWVAVAIPVTVMRRFRSFSPGAIRIMTWGGLRGGISVALALALPDVPEREVLLSITYGVVVFSILVQGLTVGRLVQSTQRG